jgi:predicted dehydrogenase
MQSRRHFIRQSAATLFAAPFTTRGLRAASPNGKLRHAAFGAAGMSMSDMMSMSAHPMWELAAVCDVDTRKFKLVKERWPDARLYQDWREMLAKEGDAIDSVNVSTPDHMHGIMAMASMARGKHVYGQKPLAHNLWECRQMVLRAREKGVMTQMGIQISSEFSERHVAALIQAGAIGKVKEAHTFSNKKWGDAELRPQTSDPIPAELNWDQWLGVASERSYIEGYDHPGNWRRRRDFGTGTLGDMGCHMFSGWFRALDLAAPISVTSRGPAPNKDNWATDAVVEYLFRGTAYTEKDTIRVTWTDGDQRPPAEVMALAGDDPKKFPTQGTLYIGTEGILLSPHTQTPRLYPQEKFTGYAYPKLEPRDHRKDYIDCCLNGSQQPSANFDYAGPLTEAVLLGCLASAFPNEKLEWDAPALQISNHEAANKLVKRDYRSGWEIV